MITRENIAFRVSAFKRKSARIEAEVRQMEWELYDDLMSDLMLPIEDEFLQILNEQEREVLEKIDELPENVTDPLSGGELLTLALIFEGAFWFTETVSRLSAYVRATMQAAYRFGLEQIGRTGEPDIRESMVREVIAELETHNYKITQHTMDEIQKIVDIALADKMSKSDFKSEMQSLFGSWKVHRPHGVSVFNVTYPFNDALFRSYLTYGIPFKQWISQRDASVRPSHTGADGQIRRISDFFQVGNAQLMYPGDLTRIETNPEEIYGCRCPIRPILDPLGAPDQGA